MIWDILGYAVEGLVRFVVYTVILFIVIKIQRLNCNLPGLLLVSFAAIAISYVPWAGPYLAYPVLIFGLRQATGADIAPDILFTVAISRAVMFCVNLFIIGALLGDLRPDLSASAREEAEEQVVESPESDDGDQGQRVAVVKPSKSSATNAPPKVVGSHHPKAGNLSLRGVSVDPKRSLAIVGAGQTFHTLTIGESFATPSGVRVRCDEITSSSVLLTIDGADQIKLRLQ